MASQASLQAITFAAICALSAASGTGVAGAAPGGGPPGWTELPRRGGPPARVWGPGLPAPGGVADAAAARRAARSVVRQYLGYLAPAVAEDELVLLSNVEAAGVRVVAFRQTRGGLPIRGAHVSVRIVRDRIVALASSAIAPPQVPARPAITRADAERAAVAAVARRAATPRAVAVRGPMLAGGRTIYEVDVEGRGTLDRFTADVDAVTGEVARLASRAVAANGTLLYRVHERHPGSATLDVPAASATVTADGSATTTDAAGGVSWPGVSAASVVPAATGAFVAVVDRLGAGAPPALDLPPDGIAVWVDPSTALGAAARSAFAHASIARARAQVIAPALAWLDETLAIDVNDDGGVCNALAVDDQQLVFLLPGDTGDVTCEVPAAIADLVYHEYAHALHHASVVPGAGDTEAVLGEALADYFAASLTGDPGWARGFFGNDRPWRHIDPRGFEYVSPEDVVGTPHETGRILSGALWDLRAALMQTHGDQAGRDLADRLAYQAMRTADSIESAYVEVLVADDDDGDLGNGTPNGCAIDIAFARHGLGTAAPPVEPQPPVADGLTVRVDVTGQASACAPAEVSGGRVDWYVRDDPFIGDSVDLAVGGDGALTAQIPAPPRPITLGYRVTVEMSDGTQRQFPRATAPDYELFAGEVTPLYCTDFEDPADDWVHAWEQGRPNGHIDSGDPRRGADGDAVLGTDLGTGNDDGRYPPATELRARGPFVTTAGFDQVRLHYWRWLDSAAADRAAIYADGALVWQSSAFQDHRDETWRFHDVDLSADPDGVVQIEFALTADAADERGGWNIDGVCIVGVGPAAGDAGAGGDAGDTDGGTGSDGGGGCGCAGGGDGAGLLLVLGAAMVAITRRRSARSPPVPRCRCRR